MNEEWILTNRPDYSPGALDTLLEKKETLYGSKESGSFTRLDADFAVYIEGYILPVVDFFSRYAHLEPAQLVATLYKKYEMEFTWYIKGCFVLILFIDDRVYVFNDRMGVRKAFYHTDPAGFIISNKLENISAHIRTEPDMEHIALRSLMHYYIDGTTFLKDVFYTRGASRLFFGPETNKLEIGAYWECSSLLDGEAETNSYQVVSDRYSELVQMYIDYLKPGKVSVTLTGGLDSRTVLAALLNRGHKPSAFTYGRAQSGDTETAKQIAETCGLEFKNFPYPELSGQWFKELAEDITHRGNSLINIHRAHRLQAMKQADDFFAPDHMLMGGFLGGENIRGIFYDNLILSEYLWQNLQGVEDKKQLVRDILEKSCINTDAVDIDRVLEIVENQKFTSPGEKARFYTLYLLEAQLHHAQDLNLYGQFIKYPVPIFMDFDFLDLLYRSRLDFRYINTGSNVLLKGIIGHELNCRMISLLAPQLANIPFLKRGHFSAREYLGNKWMLMAKRTMRHFMGKGIAPNFPLGDWMKEYVEMFLAGEDSELVDGIYDVKKLRESYNSLEEYGKGEAFWQKYTMPAALALNFREFLN
ncbi:MAG: hypothetical protein GY765_33165 [bacterium]|nr:hypothetical protein [bacterium]